MMAEREHNQRYEAKKKAEGWVRGPRITADAAEQLRILAFRHRLTPAKVVSRLLLGIGLDAELPPPPLVRTYFGDVASEQARAAFQRREGLSDLEMRDFERIAAERASLHDGHPNG